MRGTDGIVRGGMSGLATDNVGFWAGGTYAKALANLAKIILRKDGSGHLAGGNISWDIDGLLEIVGKITAGSGKIGGLDIFANSLKSSSMTFAESPVETLASLMSPDSASISPTGSWSDLDVPRNARAYSQNFTIGFDCQIRFRATAEPWFAGLDPNWAVRIKDSAGATVFSQYGTGSITNQLFYVNVPAGTYVIESNAYCTVNIGDTPYNSAAITGENTSVIYAYGYVYQTKIGNNGFYSFWDVLKYFYFSADDGLSYRGKIDIPAGLGGGSATNSGGGYNMWGTVTSATRASTVVTINHGIGDTKYTINVTPIGNYTWYAQSKGNNSIQIVCSGYFDFVLVRTPY